jgi:hypothetical protein
MKASKLKLIRGGKVHGGGHKGPPPTGPGTGRRRGRGRRPNPLNRLLWYATSRAHYKTRASGAEMIADRMTKLSRSIMGRHINVTTSNAASVIFDARRRRLFYGWTPMHVKKGAADIDRGYLPVLVDVDDMDHEIFLIDDDDLLFVVKGLKSSVGTIESMVSNDADGLSFLIGCLEALGRRADADRLREFAAECRAFARRAAEVKKHAEML